MTYKSVIIFVLIDEQFFATGFGNKDIYIKLKCVFKYFKPLKQTIHRLLMKEIFKAYNDR